MDYTSMNMSKLQTVSTYTNNLHEQNRNNEHVGRTPKKSSNLKISSNSEVITMPYLFFRMPTLM